MKARIRTFAVASAVATGAAMLGAGIVSADETASSAAVPPGRTTCIDLLTDGSSGVAQGSADQPSRFTLSVQAGGGYTLISGSDGAVTQWWADIPVDSSSWGTSRVLRACAENQGQEPASVFLRLETEEDDEVAVAAAAATVGPAPAPAPDMGPVVVVVDPEPSSPPVGPTNPDPFQSVIDQIDDLLAALVADILADLGTALAG